MTNLELEFNILIILSFFNYFLILCYIIYNKNISSQLTSLFVINIIIISILIKIINIKL